MITALIVVAFVALIAVVVTVVSADRIEHESTETPQDNPFPY